MNCPRVSIEYVRDCPAQPLTNPERVSNWQAIYPFFANAERKAAANQSQSNQGSRNEQ